MLSDWIEGYLEYNKENEAPQSYLIWCAVSAIAAALQRKVSVEWGYETLYPNLYIILVSPPGQARKGSAMAPAREMIEAAGITLAPDSTTRARLIRCLTNCTDSINDPATGSGFVHSSLTIFSPEFSVFLGAGDRRLITDLTDLYDCRSSWRDETESDALAGTLREIPKPYVNLIGATTPEQIRSTLPPDAIGSGLTSRIIFLYERTRRFRMADGRFVQTTEGRELRKKLIHDLELIRMLRGRFTVSEGYLEKYAPWYENFEEICPFDPEKFAGYWSRRQTHLRKLSMILAASKNDELILTEDIFDLARGLLLRAEQSMPMTYSSLGRTQYAEILTAVMRDIGYAKEIPFGVLLGRYIKNVTKWELEKIISAIVQVGRARVIYKGDQEIIQYIEEEEKDYD